MCGNHQLKRRKKKKTKTGKLKSWNDLAFTGTAASVSERNPFCVFIVHTLRVQGYDLALSVSTREYAEMSCARVWMSLVFCLFQDK